MNDQPTVQHGLIVPDWVRNREALREPEVPKDTRTSKHGICKGTVTSRRGVNYKCGKRTTVWLPAQLCTRCLLAAQKEMAEDDDGNE